MRALRIGREQRYAFNVARGRETPRNARHFKADLPTRPTPNLPLRKVVKLQAELNSTNDDAPVSRSPWPQANDSKFAKTLEHAIQLTPRPTKSKNGVGLVVGGGYVHSAAPELPVGLILNVDIDPSVLRWTQFCGNALRLADQREQFKLAMGLSTRPTSEESSALQRLMAQKGGRINPELVQTMLDTAQESLEDFHLLASDQRYDQCRSAHIATAYTYAHADVSSADRMNDIGNALAAANMEVTFMNLTNVGDYVLDVSSDAYRAALGSLPLHEEVFIAHSKVETYGLYSRWSQGLDNYMTATAW